MTLERKPPVRRDNHPPQNGNSNEAGRREISAGIIVYRKTEEGIKFLILYHGHSYWNFAKGKIESEEKSLEAAIRETKEETGISLKDLKLNDNFRAHERFYFKRNGQSVYKIVIFYLAESMTDQVVLSHEHQGYGWFSFEEARRILGKYRDSQRVLKQACEFLKPPRRPNAQSKQPEKQNGQQTNGQPYQGQRPRPGQPVRPPQPIRSQPSPDSVVPRPSTRTYRPGSSWQGNNVRRDRPGNR